MKPPLRLTLIHGEKIHDVKLHFFSNFRKKSLETSSTVPMSDKGVLNQRKQSQITDYSTIYSSFKYLRKYNFLDFNTVYSRLLHNHCQSDESVPNKYSLPMNHTNTESLVTLEMFSKKTPDVLCVNFTQWNGWIQSLFRDYWKFL